MRDRLHLIIKGVIVALLLVLVVGALPYNLRAADDPTWAAADEGHSSYPARGSGNLAALVGRLDTVQSRFAPTFKMTAVLPAGSLGLPGEPITWVITVSNSSAVSGTDLIITDKLPPDLRVESAQAARGEAAVSEQMVIFTLSELAPGDQATFFIYTTVRRAPPNGVFENQAALVASGPNGPVSQVALAEVSVPTGLPPTGYAPAGEKLTVGRPSLALMVALAASAVVLTALFVYYRGQRA